MVLFIGKGKASVGGAKGKERRQLEVKEAQESHFCHFT